MRLAIDARAAAEVPAGRGRVIREVLQALARLPGDDTFELLCRRPEPSLELDERFRWREIGLPDPAWNVAAARFRADALLSSNSYLTAWFARAPTAIVVYDMIPFVPGAAAQARAARIERATLGLALRRAKTALCISEATRGDLVARYPAAAAKAMVVPLAADERFLRAQPDPAVLARHGLAKPYVVAAGTLEPRKNLLRLMDAWAALPADVRDAHELVLVGPAGWEDGAIADRADRGSVRMLGFVPDAELAALYAGATACAYPSLYEGFGLPVLEAMAAGTPTLTSAVSSLPEVAGDAAVLVDPRDVPAIAEGLRRLLTDATLRADLAERGRRRAATFSWEQTATLILDALRSLPRGDGGA